MGKARRLYNQYWNVRASVLYLTILTFLNVNIMCFGVHFHLLLKHLFQLYVLIPQNVIPQNALVFFKSLYLSLEVNPYPIYFWTKHIFKIDYFNLQRPFSFTYRISLLLVSKNKNMFPYFLTYKWFLKYMRYSLQIKVKVFFTTVFVPRHRYSKKFVYFLKNTKKIPN